jgi:hypothetical protein
MSGAWPEKPCGESGRPRRQVVPHRVRDLLAEQPPSDVRRCAGGGDADCETDVRVLRSVVRLRRDRLLLVDDERRPHWLKLARGPVEPVVEESFNRIVGSLPRFAAGSVAAGE